MASGMTMTLAFIGDVAGEQIDTLRDIVVGLPRPTFALTLDRTVHMSLAALVATALFGNIVGAFTRTLGGDDPGAVLRAIDGGSGDWPFFHPAYCAVASPAASVI